MDDSQEIRVYRNTVANAGRCNACSQYIPINDSGNHFVSEVTLKTITFRVCDECSEVLIDRLTDVPKHPRESKKFYRD